ncbi:DUF262 domain-containing protein [Myxococcota bacterium]|jgi:hypothetical protein|nr:DUF262 domain-containing protein [Myxococcota bacterium]
MTPSDQTPTVADPEQQVEEPEALGDPMPATEGYSVDQIKIRTEPRAVVDVLRRVERGEFIMDPDFQRDFVWADDKQSRLVESVLMRVPLPVFYMAENLDGKLVVVDGLQRLTTLRRFSKGELSLAFTGADSDKNPLQGKTFSTLPPRLQNRFEDTTLTFYIIESGVPDRVRLDIFERVNGGEPLTRQQMRNCIYQGPATRLLKQLASSEDFIRATGGSLNPKTMRDREVINRFLAFKLLSWRDYNGDMDQHLADALKRVNTMKDAERDQLRAGFLQSMRVNRAIFGRHAFRKSSGDDRRSMLNVALFDVLSVAFSEGDPTVWLAHKEQIAARVNSAWRHTYGPFERAISYSTNSRKPVQDRFGLVQEMLQEVLNADPA